MSEQDLFGCSSQESYNLFEFGFGMEGNLQNDEIVNWFDMLETQTDHYLEYSRSTLSSPQPHTTVFPKDLNPADTTAGDAVKTRRRRQRKNKNKEEIEKQRLTHITMERNRRKQMNNYLSLLRQLMPDSYVQRRDQASIIGGAINYVKELEYRLQFLDRKKWEPAPVDSPGSIIADSVILDDVEVMSVVENHANLRIRSKRKPKKQLLKMVSGLQKLRFTVLHLNVTTLDDDDQLSVLYSLIVKVEDDCQVGKCSVDEIASVVNQILMNSRIEDDHHES